MDFSIFTSIGIEAAKLAGQKISQDHRVLAVLKKVGLGEIKAGDFETVYAHSLVEYGAANHIPQLTQLFANKDVVALFKDILFTEDKELEDNVTGKFVKLFSEKLDEKKYEWLLEYYKTGEELTVELEKFNAIFIEMTNKSRTPAELETFNKIKNLELRDFEKSYDCQILEYNERLVQNFYKEFLEDDKYVYQNGTVELKEKFIQDCCENGEKKAERKSYEPVDKFINIWLNNTSSNLLILLGEYGTGKSTLCSFILHQLAKKETGTKINDKIFRQPLIFRLKNYKGSIEDFIKKEFNNNGVTDSNFSFAHFKERVENNEYVIIFDGFDEMSLEYDDEGRSRTFSKLEEIIKLTNSKVIITCREEYFKSDLEIKETFELRVNKNSDILHLSLFNEEQIKTYLQKNSEEPDVIWRGIKNIYDVRDLAERPVLLEMIVQNLPELIRSKEKINASKLYEITIKKVLEKKSDELKRLVKNKYRLKILEEIAQWLFLNDALSFDVNEITSDIGFEKWFNIPPGREFEDYFGDFIVSSFLIRDEENPYHFRISHKSFVEYLTASKIVKNIAEKDFELLNQKRLTDRIKEFIIEQNPLVENLQEKFYAINNSGFENRLLASNLVYLLSKLNRSILKNCTFENVVFEGINFSWILFNGAKFINSSFINCYFRIFLFGSKKIENCDFKESFLDLSENQLNKLPLELVNLKSLSSLSLTSNLLSRLSKRIGNLNSLVSLNLMYNQLKTLPSEIGNLTSLTNLYLSNNQLTALPTEIGNLTSLTGLDLSGNQLITLPLEIGNLTLLTSLDLSGTRLSTLPSEIGNLTSLTYLDLSGTQLSTLPSEIVNLTSLTFLDLSGTQLSTLPSEIVNLTSLTYLNLSGTQLSTFPSEIVNLTSLTSLYLSGTQLSTLPSEIVNLTSLTALDLSNNQLNEIPEELLENNELGWIELRNNPIPKSLIEEYKKQRPDIIWMT